MPVSNLANRAQQAAAVAVFDWAGVMQLPLLSAQHPCLLSMQRQGNRSTCKSCWQVFHFSESKDKDEDEVHGSCNADGTEQDKHVQDVTLPAQTTDKKIS